MTTSDRFMVRHGMAGFSLLEMMIVILVVGLLYSLAISTVSLPGDDPFNTEVDGLQERIRLAQDESLIRSQALALGFHDAGYGFFAQNAQSQWQPLKQDGLLGTHPIPGAFKQNLFLDGQAVVLPAASRLHPQVFILPTGEMMPFEWHLRAADGRERTLKFDNIGRLEAAVNGKD